jgi:preprotein translocase subunit SecE
MKLNGKTIKVVFAFVIIFATIVWAMGSLLPTTYNGSDLNLGVGAGIVTVTNPSDASIPVQLVGSGSRSFTVSSTIEGVSGSSTRLGTGSSSTNMFEFELPPGISEFTIVRGTNVKFVADTATRLRATVNPLSADSSRTTIIVAIVVVLGSLFYMSRTIDHSWMRALRPQKTSVQNAGPIPVPVTADVNQGRDGRMYSDT